MTNVSKEFTVFPSPVTNSMVDAGIAPTGSTSVQVIVSFTSMDLRPRCHRPVEVVFRCDRGVRFDVQCTESHRYDTSATLD